MARPPRIELAGAIYHVTARGDGGESVFDDDTDRMNLLSIFAQAAERFDARALAFCLMDNHYHFVIRTDKPNLSRLMRHVNGVYTQMYNRRHGTSGNLFRGRFKAILVDRNAYFLEVCRHVDLNPVRAGSVRAPHRWPWSSYVAHTGRVTAPEWLDTAAVHTAVLGRPLKNRSDARRAAQRYAAFVTEGKGVPLWETGLRSQIYLGDSRFVKRMQTRSNTNGSNGRRTARGRRLSAYLANSRDRDAGIADAYRKGGYTMIAIAEHVGLSVSQVSRIIKNVELRQYRVAE
jgi:REP element-mobilizing transposase RayT